MLGHENKFIAEQLSIQRLRCLGYVFAHFWRPFTSVCFVY